MRTLAEDTHPEAERILIELLRKASPKRRMAMVLSANRAARTLALTGLRERYPGESAARHRHRLADVWLGPDLATKAYGPLPEHEWYEKRGKISGRQWQDLLGVMEIQGHKLDSSYFAHWAKELRVTDLLERALDEAGLAGKKP